MLDLLYAFANLQQPCEHQTPKNFSKTLILMQTHYICHNRYVFYCGTGEHNVSHISY